MKTLKQWYICCYFVGGSYYASDVACSLTPSEARKTNESEAGAKYWLLTEDYEPTYNMTGYTRCDGSYVECDSPMIANRLHEEAITNGEPVGMQLLRRQLSRRAA